MPGLVLIGYRGCGKSTVAQALSLRSGLPWADADVLLTTRLRMPIAEFFHRHGEPAFRDREEALLAELLPQADGILATGGGCVERAATRALLAAGPRPVAYLHAPVAVLQARLRADPAGRPALAGSDPASEVPVILARREPWYRASANRLVAAEQPLDAVVAELEHLLTPPSQR